MKLIAIATFMTLGLPATASAQPSAALSMTCDVRVMNEIEAVRYWVDGDTLYRSNGADTIPLSTRGRRLFLSTSTEANGSKVSTFASHSVTGSILKRTVFWQPQGKPMRARFTDTLDFARKRITGGVIPTERCYPTKP